MIKSNFSLILLFIFSLLLLYFIIRNFVQGFKNSEKAEQIWLTVETFLSGQLFIFFFSLIFIPNIISSSYNLNFDFSSFENSGTTILIVLGILLFGIFLLLLKALKNNFTETNIKSSSLIIIRTSFLFLFMLLFIFYSDFKMHILIALFIIWALISISVFPISFYYFLKDKISYKVPFGYIIINFLAIGFLWIANALINEYELCFKLFNINNIDICVFIAIVGTLAGIYFLSTCPNIVSPNSPYSPLLPEERVRVRWESAGGEGEKYLYLTALSLTGGYLIICGISELIYGIATFNIISNTYHYLTFIYRITYPSLFTKDLITIGLFLILMLSIQAERNIWYSFFLFIIGLEIILSGLIYAVTIIGIKKLIRPVFSFITNSTAFICYCALFLLIIYCFNNDSQVLTNNAVVKLNDEEYWEAQNICNTVLEKDKKNFDANLITGIALLKQEKYSTAIDYFNTALSIKPTYSVFALIGNCYLQLKNYTKASYYYKQAASKTNRWQDRLNLINLANYQNGLTEQANKEYFENIHQALQDAILTSAKKFIFSFPSNHSKIIISKQLNLILSQSNVIDLYNLYVFNSIPNLLTSLAKLKNPETNMDKFIRYIQKLKDKKVFPAVEATRKSIDLQGEFSTSYINKNIDSFFIRQLDNTKLKYFPVDKNKFFITQKVIKALLSLNPDSDISTVRALCESVTKTKITPISFNYPEYLEPYIKDGWIGDSPNGKQANYFPSYYKDNRLRVLAEYIINQSNIGMFHNTCHYEERSDEVIPKIQIASLPLAMTYETCRNINKFDAFEVVKALNEWIFTYIRYDYCYSFNNPQITKEDFLENIFQLEKQRLIAVNDILEVTNSFTSPFKILKTTGGICIDKANLLIHLCRALNIPSKCMLTSFGFNHAFVSAFVNNKWIYLDPTNTLDVYTNLKSYEKDEIYSPSLKRILHIGQINIKLLPAVVIDEAKPYTKLLKSDPKRAMVYIENNDGVYNENVL